MATFFQKGLQIVRETVETVKTVWLQVTPSQRKERSVVSAYSSSSSSSPPPHPLSLLQESASTD